MHWMIIESDSNFRVNKQALYHLCCRAGLRKSQNLPLGQDARHSIGIPSVEESCPDPERSEATGVIFLSGNLKAEVEEILLHFDR
jgi:hypothetical protein